MRFTRFAPNWIHPQNRIRSVKIKISHRRRISKSFPTAWKQGFNVFRSASCIGRAWIIEKGEVRILYLYLYYIRMAWLYFYHVLTEWKFRAPAASRNIAARASVFPTHVSRTYKHLDACIFRMYESTWYSLA